MSHFTHILTAACTALALLACTDKEQLVTKPVALELKINSVTGTKVAFTVNSSDKNATYIFFCVSEENPYFKLSDQEVVDNYLGYMGNLVDEFQTGALLPDSFEDNVCYRGSRNLRLTLLSSDELFRLLLFQVNPRTHEVIGDIISEEFRTKPVIMKPLDFDFSIEDDVLTITPSDPDRTYFWGFDRLGRINDDYDAPYFFLYFLLDMYEEYGFTEHILSKGTVRYTINKSKLWEGEEYLVSAFGYEDGEINSDESDFSFILRDGKLTPYM